MGNSFIRFMLALSLISVGVILILENLGFTTFHARDAWLFIYPLIFVLYGLKLIIDRVRYKGGSLGFGSFLLIFGSLLLMDRFEMIHFHFKDIFKLWPLLIIYLGFMFFRSPGGKVVYRERGKKDKTYYKNSSFSIGSYEYNQQNWKVEPLYLSNLAGDFYFDFTKAFIPEKATPITINALAGDVHILMPENVDFRVNAIVKAGDIDIIGQSVEGINRSLTYETIGYDEAVRKINFTLKLKAGSVRIDQIGGKGDV